MSSKIVLKPVPEVNERLFAPLPTGTMTIKPVPTETEILSIVVAEDELGIVLGGLNLTPEQTESLFYFLADRVGDERYDLGFAEGYRQAQEATG